MPGILIYWCILAIHTGLNVSTLSRTPLAQFSRKTKHHIRSCGFTTSYLFEMFFTTREKCCYMLIFANECAVLFESFEIRFEATPFFVILCRWRKFLQFIYFISLRSSSSRSHYPTSTIALLNIKQVQVEDLSKSFKVI